MPETVTADTLLLRAADTLEVLAETAAPVDAEWQYVRDLVAVWGGRLRAVATAAAGRPGPPGAEAAIERLTAEAAAITDPHRAIDWLSTFPQAALLAVGETPA